jgi:hypothetical protein
LWTVGTHNTRVGPTPEGWRLTNFLNARSVLPIIAGSSFGNTGTRREAIRPGVISSLYDCCRVQTRRTLQTLQRACRNKLPGTHGRYSLLVYRDNCLSVVRPQMDSGDSGEIASGGESEMRPEPARPGLCFPSTPVHFCCCLDSSQVNNIKTNFGGRLTIMARFSSTRRALQRHWASREKFSHRF